MSLLDDAYEEFTVLNKTRIEDGYGGFNSVYVDGVKIQGAMDFDTSIQARTADAQGAHSVYTLTTKKNVVLEYHDVIRRTRDSKVFRVTSDGDDKFTPVGASLNMRQVTCEEWTLPEGTDG